MNFVDKTSVCKSCKQSFLIDASDFGFYEQMKVPPPTWCPQCRMMRRLSWTGYRILYKRKCDFTSDVVITAIHPAVKQTVYRQDVWWSDKWDAKSYGKEYDFNRSFFEQYKELFQTVPFPALFSEYPTMVNSEYCNAAGYCKNCYLAFRVDYTEDCAYTNVISRAKNSFDIAYGYDIELCYDTLNVGKSYQAFFSQDCIDCHSIYFSKDLSGCSNCIGCINLRGKNYCIFNEQFTKEEYEKKLKEFDFGSEENRRAFQEKANLFFLSYPRKQFHGRNNVDVSGDYIGNSKNVRNSYMVTNGENIRFGQLLKTGPAANAYDYTMFGLQAEWIYDSTWVGLTVNNMKFCVWNYGAHDLEYSFGCHGSGNLFGCVGLRKAEYCILNRQYSKEDYESLVEKIKKQMSEVPYRDALAREYRYGEHFPAELSPWGINETAAYEFYPYSKEAALAGGFNWSDEDKREYKEATMVVPDHIKDVTDDILKAILKCDCGKNYQIISMELQFLRRFSLPIPRKCSLCRDRARIRQLNPMEIFDRTCAKCQKPIKTSYAPERSEIVYCESCYQQEVA